MSARSLLPTPPSNSRLATSRLATFLLSTSLLALGAGCATTELSGREVLRVAPLREGPVKPAAVDDAPVFVEAGADALTDEELEAIQGRLGKHFEERLRARGDEAGAARAVGTARVVRCRVRAGAGRRNTVYQARCRVTLEAEGASLVEVQASARRLRAPRAVSEAEAERIARLVRNPLLSADDSEEALKSALDHAAHLLIAGAAAVAKEETAEEGAGPTEDVALDEGALRRVALMNAKKEGLAERLSAAMDLARWGRSEDGVALLPLLDDERPRVRQATALALGELAPKAAWEPLLARRDDGDEGVRAAVATALARLSALYPDLRAPPASAGPSNSSTPGAGVRGEM